MEIDSCNEHTFATLIKECQFNDNTFNEFIKQKILMGSLCQNCNTIHCPPRAFCPECHSEKIVCQQLTGTGQLKAFTSIFVCSPQMAALGYSRNNPYCTGVIKLDEGPRLNTPLLGVDAKKPETIKIGTPMEIKYLTAPNDKEKTDCTPFKFAFQPHKLSSQ